MFEVATNAAPPSIGPFSQAIVSGDKMYVSGQGPIDPNTGDIVSEDVTHQSEQVLDNIEAILKAGGTSIDDIVKATVFLRDMSLYDEVNEVYANRMDPPYPARSAVEVVELPVDILVEIEVVAEV